MQRAKQMEHKNEDAFKGVELTDFRACNYRAQRPQFFEKFQNLPAEIAEKAGAFLPANDFIALFKCSKSLLAQRQFALKSYLESDRLNKISAHYWRSEELRKKVLEIINLAIEINNNLIAMGKAPHFKIYPEMVSSMKNWVESLADNANADMGKKVVNQIRIIRSKLSSLSLVIPTQALHQLYVLPSLLENITPSLKTLNAKVIDVWDNIEKIDQALSLFATAKKLIGPDNSSDKDAANEATLKSSA